jgi:polyferredoxin
LERRLWGRRFKKHNKRKLMLILLIILFLLLVGTAPAWPYSRGWGYYPSGGIGTILLILLLLWLLGVF